MRTVLFLLFPFFLFSQKYKYENIFLRDDLGKFNSLNKSGYFEIKKDSVSLFDQKLKINSSRLMFDSNSIYSGKMFTCTDGYYFYTFYLTINNELFFYTKTNQMIKFVLTLIKKE
jgi:hypothetical protein